MNKPWTKEGKILEQVPIHTKYGMKVGGRWKSAAERPAAKYFPKISRTGAKATPLSWHEVRAKYEKRKAKEESFSEYLHKYYTPYAKGDSTAEMYRRDPSRQLLHRKIVGSIVDYANTPPAGQKPIAILMGGGAASGKSFVRSTLIDPAMKAGGIRLGLCDPDDMKSRLPEWSYFLENSPKEAGTITHQESVQLTNEAFYALMDQGKNIIYDNSMRVVGEYRNKIQELHEHGYNVVVIGVTTDVDVALDRAHKRERQMPDNKIRETHAGFATAWDFIKDYADDFQLYDSTQGALELVENMHGVQDHTLMDAFYDRGKNGARRRALQRIADRYDADLETLWEMYKDGMSFDEITDVLDEVYGK